MTDEQLKARTAEIRRGLTAKKLQAPSMSCPRAFAIIRESMDRNIGIRTIFNPVKDELVPSSIPTSSTISFWRSMTAFSGR